MYICWQLVSPGAMRLIGDVSSKKKEKGKGNVRKGENSYRGRFGIKKYFRKSKKGNLGFFSKEPL